MGAPDQNRIESEKILPQRLARGGASKKPKTILNCNFRSAGGISNEDARSLTAIHETFARQLASALDAYLGTGLQIKLETIDQFFVKDHVKEIPPANYILPFSSNAVFVELEHGLTFPIVDLLMGGAGIVGGANRDLSEIEEEIIHDLVLLIARRAEMVWSIPNAKLIAAPRIKPFMILDCLPPDEKVIVVRFTVEIAGTTGSLRLMMNTEMFNQLINRIKRDRPGARARVRSFPMPPLRERILDCDLMLTAELPEVKVAVRDLIALQPGSVLKLRAPVRVPAVLTTAGRSLFESIPVRNGTQRAAQLGSRTAPKEWKRR